MLGPLPRIHQVAVAAACLIVCTFLALWIGWVLPITVMPSTLVLLGACAGGAAAYLLLHDSTRRPASGP